MNTRRVRDVLKHLWSVLVQRERPAEWISLTHEGFELHRGGVSVGGVAWREVERITAFKRDLITVDSICLEFKLAGEKGFFEVNDDVGGFWELVGLIKEIFPTSLQDWEEAVGKPVFAPNITVIYERASIADS